jgi:hypothetical protein
MESQVGKLSWLNAEILESLCGGIDALINEFSLDFITREDWPPESLIEKGRRGLQDRLWYVDVSPVLMDFFINQFRDFSC